MAPAVVLCLVLLAASLHTASAVGSPDSLLPRHTAAGAGVLSPLIDSSSLPLIDERSRDAAFAEVAALEGVGSSGVAPDERPTCYRSLDECKSECLGRSCFTRAGSNCCPYIPGGAGAINIHVAPQGSGS